MYVVNRGLEAIIKRFCTNTDGLETLKAVDTDVEAIKEFLRLNIGTTFAQCTTPSDANLLGLDMKHWGGDRSAVHKWNGTPWAQRRRAMQDYRRYVMEKVCKACPWHRWL